MNETCGPSVILSEPTRHVSALDCISSYFGEKLYQVHEAAYLPDHRKMETNPMYTPRQKTEHPCTSMCMFRCIHVTYPATNPIM
jgi:hypothetical protein